jgi:hypothetical protein
MNVSDEIRRTLSDPKPFYALAGAGDLAAEKLKDAPERLRDAPTLLAEAGATLTTLANKIAAEAPERLGKVTSGVQDAAGKGRPDPQALRGIAQSLAIQQVGRLLEAAGKAVETYDGLAERGKVVIGRYTGTGAETAAGEAGAADGPVTVLVEQVTDEDDDFDDLDEDEYGFAKPQPRPAEPAQAEPVAEETDEPFEASRESAAEAAEAFEQRPDSAAEAAQVFEEASAAEAAEKKAAPKKPAPRKRAAGPKAPRPPKD